MEIQWIRTHDADFALAKDAGRGFGVAKARAKACFEHA
jgi:hypothetical protein